MFDLNAVRTDLATEIAALSMKTALDPRDVNPPVVVVGLPVVKDWLSPCVIDVDIEITAVAPPPGNLDAVEWLLDTTAALLDHFTDALATPSSFTPVAGQQPLPAYTLVLNQQVKE
jgi:hypothetical protein